MKPLNLLTFHNAKGSAFRLGLLLTLGLVLIGCQSTKPRFAEANFSGEGLTPLTPVGLSNRVDASWLATPTNLFTLGPGDKLELEILGEPASRTMTMVGPDGKVYFNLLPGIDVWGLTLGQAKSRLEEELGKFMRDRPQVSLVLRGVESKRVWILGRVQQPGVYALAAPMTLLEVLSMAGGTLAMTSYRDQEAAGVSEELADLSHSFVLREGTLLPINFEKLLKKGDLSQNIYLQPDDFIYLPAATSREIYVLGAVTQPRIVPYREGMGVAAAVASAYGTIKGAYMHHVAVVRGALQNPEMAVVDYKAVIRGETKDMELQPNDIVYVPFSPYRYLIKYAELVVNTFVSSAAINAGTRAVGQVPTGGAGVFIPVGSGIQVIPPIAPPPIK